jgi:LmbE family N-acetylglucosaminyl deacetylase
MNRVASNPSISEHSLTGEKLSLLAIFAHPEDESFGPAGTLAKYACEGVQVLLVAATRSARPELAIVGVSQFDDTVSRPRDRLCSCRASGIRRACFFDYAPGELSTLDPLIIQDQLVRLIREIQPQVIVTFGPQGLAGDKDRRIVNQLTHAAFRDAGDSTKFPHHFREGLGAFTSQKLYYCVLPATLANRWGIQGLSSVPDDEITTVIDISAYGEAMRNALYCHRSQELDLIRWLIEEQQVNWDREYYSLVESRLNKRPRREKDLFAGLR